MPLPIPDLDDRRFDDLVAEARALIPTLAPAWTNHNPSDPGITLVELFAHLTELLIYRLNRVTSENVCAFLNLLDSTKSRAPVSAGSTTIVIQPAGDPPPDPYRTELAVEIRVTIQTLRTIARATSSADFETLALDPAAAGDDPKGTVRSVARALCIGGRNLRDDPAHKQPGDVSDYVSVVVLPSLTVPKENIPALLAKVKAFLDDRRLLATRVLAVGPFPLPVQVQASVLPRADQTDTTTVQELVATTINDYLGPYYGGPDGHGWPFGRNVYSSELYAVIARLPVIQSVGSLTLTPVPADRVVSGGVRLEPYELVQTDPPAMTAADVTILKTL